MNFNDHVAMKITALNKINAFASSIRVRLLGGYGLLIGAMLLLGGIFLMQISSVIEAQHDINRSTERLLHSETKEAAIVQAELLAISWIQPVQEEQSALMRYVMSEDEDEQQALFEQFGRLGERIVKIGDDLAAIVDDDDLRAKIKEIQSVQLQIRDAAVMVIASYDGEGEYGEESRIAMKDFSNVLNSLMSLIKEFQLLVREKVAAENQAIMLAISNVKAEVEVSVESLEESSFLTMVLVGFSLLMAFTVSSLIYRSIVNPLNSATSLANRIAAYDLTIHGDQKLAKLRDGKDEVSVLVNALSDMRADLAGLIARIKVMGEGLSSASVELSQRSELINTVTNDQLVKITGSADISQDMKKLSEEMAQGAIGAADVASEADSLVNKCVREEVQLTNAAMTTVQTEMSSTSDRISALAESADKIGDIVTVISGIAEQTNLLALNAAIEAARAGEQGRGFAVVADEVRTLAERTSEATKTIADMIGTVQSQVKQASGSVEQSVQSVDAGRDAIDKIMSTLQGIQELNHKLKTANEVVANSTKGQQDSADRIASNLEVSQKGTADLYEHSQSISEQATGLNEFVVDLNEAIARFKV